MGLSFPIWERGKSFSGLSVSSRFIPHTLYLGSLEDQGD